MDNRKEVIMSFGIANDGSLYDQKNEGDLVRCWDCRFSNNCEIQHSAMAGDMFFCGAAERKEEEN